MPIIIILGCTFTITVIAVGFLYFVNRRNRMMVPAASFSPAPVGNLDQPNHSIVPAPDHRLAEIKENNGADHTNGNGAISNRLKPSLPARKLKVKPYISKNQMGHIVLKTAPKAKKIEGKNGETLTIKDFNAHALVLGQTGTGKTRRFLTQVMLNYFEGHHLPPGPDRERLKFAGFFLDPKAEFVNFIWTLAKRYGRHEDVIFFGPTHLDNAFDPFGDPEELPLQRASKMLAVVKALDEGRKSPDPFWDNSAEKLFLNLFILHGEVFKVYPKEAQKMSFTLLNLLLTDKGQAMNMGELSNWDAKRNEYFQQFDRACKQLVAQIIEMTPDLERTSRQVLTMQSELERQENVKAETRVAIASIKRLFEGVRSSQMVDIEGEMMSMEVEGGRLIMQLQSIKTAATQYTITNDDKERMHFEHTLVRSGADLRDMVYDRLGSLNVEYLTERNYQALKRFCGIYEDVLIAYDTLAKLKKPEEQTGALTRLLNLYQKVITDRGMQPQDDPVYAYFKNEFLNVANDKTAGSVAMVCTNVTSKMIHPPFCYLFTSEPTWSWKSVIDEGKVVVMDMSRAMYTSAAEITYVMMKTDYFRVVLGRKILSVIDKTTGQKRKMNQDRELLYMVDEFQVAVSTGKETGEASFLDRAREYKGSCCLATQSTSMLLKSIPKDEVMAIYTNTQTKIFFANDDPETTKYVSDIGGMRAWLSGNFSNTAEQRAFNTKEFGDPGFTFTSSMDMRYKHHDVAQLGPGEAIMKLPSRFGGRFTILKTTLELELLEDENADFPVPRMDQPILIAPTLEIQPVTA